MTYATELKIDPIPLEYCEYIKEHIDSFDILSRSFFDSVLIVRSLPEHIEKWLKTNIADIDWFVGKFKANYPAIHRDNGLAESLWFLVQKGNEGVESLFYAPDGQTVIENQVLDENKWHLFKNDIWHNQGGLQDGNERIIVWGRVHGYHSTWREVLDFAADPADYNGGSDPDRTGYICNLKAGYNTIPLSLYSDMTDLFYADTGLKKDEIVSAISRGQIYSKQWLVQELETRLPNQAHVFIFGGWIGLAARLLFEKYNTRIASITCIDLDGSLAKANYHLNNAFGDKFKFIQVDVFNIDLEVLMLDIPFENRVFINCSCDNIDSTERYVKEITPFAAVNVLQQNNYENTKSHLSVKDMDEFKQQIKELDHIVYLDTIKFPMYERYMAISIKE